MKPQLEKYTYLDMRSALNQYEFDEMQLLGAKILVSPVSVREWRRFEELEQKVLEHRKQTKGGWLRGHSR